MKNIFLAKKKIVRFYSFLTRRLLRCFGPMTGVSISDICLLNDDKICVNTHYLIGQ